jgi:hypothetical protein
MKTKGTLVWDSHQPWTVAAFGIIRYTDADR